MIYYTRNKHPSKCVYIAQSDNQHQWRVLLDNGHVAWCVMSCCFRTGGWRPHVVWEGGSYVINRRLITGWICNDKRSMKGITGHWSALGLLVVTHRNDWHVSVINNSCQFTASFSHDEWSNKTLQYLLKVFMIMNKWIDSTLISEESSSIATGSYGLSRNYMLHFVRMKSVTYNNCLSGSLASVEIWKCIWSVWINILQMLAEVNKEVPLRQMGNHLVKGQGMVSPCGTQDLHFKQIGND